MTHKFNMNKPANFQVSIPRDHDVSVPEYLAVVKRDIPRWAQEYVDHVDTATTEDICKCEWDIHPDDLEIRPTHCRTCRHPKERHTEGPCKPHTIDQLCEAGCTEFKPRRVKLGDPNPECPVHSPVGRIMGFFEYIFDQNARATDMGGMTGEPKGIVNQVTEEEGEAFIDAFREKFPKFVPGKPPTFDGS